MQTNFTRIFTAQKISSTVHGNVIFSTKNARNFSCDLLRTRKYAKQVLAIYFSSSISSSNQLPLLLLNCTHGITDAVGQSFLHKGVQRAGAGVGGEQAVCHPPARGRHQAPPQGGHQPLQQGQAIPKDNPFSAI